MAVRISAEMATSFGGASSPTTMSQLLAMASKSRRSSLAWFRMQQSWKQEEQDSVARQVLSPQQKGDCSTTQRSFWHVNCWHEPACLVSHWPQSDGQVHSFSLGSQTLLPHALSYLSH